MRTQANRITKSKRSSLTWSNRLAVLLIIVAVFLLFQEVVQRYRHPTSVSIIPAVAGTAPPVQFDFYTVLPKMAVTAPAASADTVPGKVKPKERKRNI